MYFELKIKHDHNIANDNPCSDKRNGLYDKLDANLKGRVYTQLFHVSQAIWTPDEKAIAKYTFLNVGNRKPSLYHWTADQYRSNGPFDKWLKTVETCRTRLTCCSASNFGNIIMRDFPTPDFGLAVVNKNFQSARGDQFECNEREAAREERERLAEEKRKYEALQKAIQVRC